MQIRISQSIVTWYSKHYQELGQTAPDLLQNPRLNAYFATFCAVNDVKTDNKFEYIVDPEMRFPGAILTYDNHPTYLLMAGQLTDWRTDKQGNNVFWNSFRPEISTLTDNNADIFLTHRPFDTTMLDNPSVNQQLAIACYKTVGVKIAYDFRNLDRWIEPLRNVDDIQFYLKQINYKTKPSLILQTDGNNYDLLIIPQSLKSIAPKMALILNTLIEINPACKLQMLTPRACTTADFVTDLRIANPDEEYSLWMRWLNSIVNPHNEKVDRGIIYRKQSKQR